MARLECEHVELRNSSGDVVCGDLRFVDGNAGNPLVIVCHSFMAFKNWGFFPRVGENLARAGFVSFVFDFSHNGVVCDGDRITDFQRFEQNTFTQELEDLRTVVDAAVSGRMRSGTIPGGSRKAGRGKTVLLGHSRGGGIAIVHAASDERIDAMVTMSSVGTFDRWTDHQKRLWKSKGYLPLARDTSLSPLRLGLNLLDDLETHREHLTITAAAAKVHVPWLLLHGEADVMVQPKEAEQLYSAADKTTTEFVLLEKVGHLYNGEAREKDGYRMLDRTVDMISHWLQKIF